MTNDLKISETRDAGLIWNLLCEREIFDCIPDNMKPDKKSIVSLVENPANIFLKVEKAGVFVGAFLLYAIAGTVGTFEVHTLLRIKGRDAIAAGKAAMEHVFKLPGVEKLYSVCPAYNQKSYIFALLCGWHESAVVHAIRLWKDGIQYPVKLVEVSRNELCPQFR
jgi:hypothetical protein